MPTNRALGSGVVLAAILVFTACNRQVPVAPAPVALENAPENSGQAEITDQMKDVLAAADQVDGMADKIVAKCASCNLAMDGTQEHALQVGEFTLLFCADDCKESFAKDLEKSVLGIKLPN